MIEDASDVRVDVAGTPISATSYEEVLTRLDAPPVDRAAVIAFCNVHSVMSARRDPALATALRDADLATPDGMPLVWSLRQEGYGKQSRVYGPDLLELALQHGVERGWRHYLFGTTDETLDLLERRAAELAPGVRIVGRHAPPFRPLTPAEEDGVLRDIRDSGAQLVWVGLGMPKQELWMHRVRDRLPGVTVLGVGAAFDLVSGRVAQAPDWVQDRGLEWAYRLWKEPRRLWRRYLVNNPLFLVLFLQRRVRLLRSRSR